MSKWSPGSMTTGAIPPQPDAVDPKVEDPVMTSSSQSPSNIMSISPDLIEPSACAAVKMLSVKAMQQWLQLLQSHEIEQDIRGRHYVSRSVQCCKYAMFCTVIAPIHRPCYTIPYLVNTNFTNICSKLKGFTWISGGIDNFVNAAVPPVDDICLA